MKKILQKFFSVFCTILLLSLYVMPYGKSDVLAQNELLLGQNHKYTVTFRGNGEAIVYAKLIINNPNDEEITDFSFEVPKTIPSEMVIYQQILPKRCAETEQISTKNQQYKTICKRFEYPDYNNYYSGYSSYYDGGSSKTVYKKIDLSASGNLYKLSLPNSIEPYKSGAIIVSYATKGYARNNLGLFKFNFETLKVPSRINEVEVAVDVDSDLIMKGKKSKVNYNTTKNKSDTAPALGVAPSITSPSLDRLVNNIGESGVLTKEAKNLSPNESFSVKGEYAVNWWRLYIGQIFIVIFVIVAVFAGLYFLSNFLRRKKQERVYQNTDDNIDQTMLMETVSVFKYGIAGLISAVSAVILTYILIAIAESDILYDILPSSSVEGIFVLMVFLTILILYGLVILGPAIFLAAKHGWKSFIFVLLAEFLWFILFIIIFILVFQTGIIPNTYNYRGGIY